MIDRSTNIQSALRSRQRGFLLNPFRFGGGTPPGGDPHWANVVMLLHCDGADGSTTITDSSTSGKTVSANGGASLSTSSPLYGSASASLPSGGWLQVPDSSDWAFGSSDFTVEISARFDANPSSSAGDYGICLIGQTVAATSGRSWMIHIGGSNLSSCNVYCAVYFGAGGEHRASASGVNLSLHTKHVFAMSRVGGTLYMLLNGVVIASKDITGTNVKTSTNSLTIGRFNDPGYTYFLDGDIDEVRITKGIGRYSSSYTPSADPFPDY